MLHLRNSLPSYVLAVSLVCIATATLMPSTPWERQGVEVCIFCGDGLADVVTNVILFLPLGVALCGLGFTRRLAGFTGTLLSALIELAQLWVPGRDSSLGDVLSNSLGTLLGFVIAASAATWLRPAPRLAYRLATGWSVGAAAVLMGTALLLLPAIPSDHSLYGLWTPNLANFDWYRGRVISAQLGTVAVNNGPAENGDALRAELAAQAPAMVHAIAGPRTERLAPLFSISDDLYREILLVGPERGDWVFRYRLLAVDAGLEQPEILRARGLSDELGEGDSLLVTASMHDGEACLTVNAARHCAAGPGVAGGWRLLASGDGFAPWLLGLLGCCWLTVLIFPVGYWAPSWRSALPLLSLVLLSLAATRLSAGPVLTSSWVIVVVAFAAGAVTRRLGRRGFGRAARGGS